jgi:hypothetical protein
MRATVGELDAIAKEPRAAHFSDCETTVKGPTAPLNGKEWNLGHPEPVLYLSC